MTAVANEAVGIGGCLFTAYGSANWCTIEIR